MLGNNERLLQQLIDCLDPGEQTPENAARLEQQAASLIENHPKLLALHSSQDNNVTPLMAAVMSPNRCCSLDLFKKLLKKPSNIEAVKDHNIRVIHYLARYNRHEHLQLLLAQKPDVNAATQDGDTPLGFAALTGAHQALGLLAIVGSAKVNQANVKKQIPLHIACFFGQTQGGKRTTPITEAEAMQYLECIDVLLMAGSDVNARDEYGSTPAHCLVSADIPDEIKREALTKLIEHGADLTIRASNNNTVIEMTKGYQFDAFSEELKKHIVPSLRTLAAKKVIEMKSTHPVTLIDDIARLLNKLRLGRGGNEDK